MRTVLFGIASAFSWGAGDFMGGLISRRIGALRTTLYIQAYGIVPLIGLVLIFRERGMPCSDWLWSGSAGVIGSMALLALYQALAAGKMATSAPVAAIISASLPVIVGIFKDGMPSVLTLSGFLLAVLAIWFISRPDTGTATAKAGLLAGQAGRMDITAVLASLYSGVTVFMAWLITREKIKTSQRIGILASLAAIVLITL
jgi:drug/metabolite transporter (DMT)-like permease